MQTIGMGGTEILDSKRPDQNRVVEVWAVVPKFVRVSVLHAID